MPGPVAKRAIVVSGGASAAAALRPLARPAAASADRPVRKWRRFWMICTGLSFLEKGTASRRWLYVFNSCFISSRKRQSVPLAMIVCGSDLIMPVSCRRSA